jgi:hypothetical protein
MPRRNKTQREADLVETARLYCQGVPQSEIAAQVGVDQTQISQDLKVIRARWQERFCIEINEHKSAELANIDHLERTYWTAWEKSCGNKTTKQARMNGETVGSKTLREENRDGNPAFLQGVMTCIEKRCRLMGLDAPEKKEHTGKDGAAIPIAILTGEDAERATREYLTVIAGGGGQ